MSAVGLIKSCQRYFGTKELYKVLAVDKEASEAEIKKAYYKTSLNVHPDRVIATGRKEATEKFQILGQVYSILSDKDKRAIYDETGNVDEEEGDEPSDWNEYWRLLFKKITVDDIDKFKEEYQGSSEEVDDLKEIYERSKGTMTKILENMFFADGENEDRLRSILIDLIDKNEIKEYDVFVNEPQKEKEKRRKKQMAEKKEAEKELLERNSSASNGSSLVAKIRQNSKNRFESTLDSLEKKYGGKTASKKRARGSPSPSQSSSSSSSSSGGDDDYVEKKQKKPQRKKRSTVAKVATGSKFAAKADVAPAVAVRTSMRGKTTSTKRGRSSRK